MTLHTSVFPRRLPPAGSPIGLQDFYGWLQSIRCPREVLPTFASEIESRLGVAHTFFLSTGRAALVIALRALQKMAGQGKDEVVLPAFTCFSVPAAVIKAGMRVRICDTDPYTLDYDYDDLEAADYKRVLCIVSSNLYGLPNDLPRLERVARDRGVFLVDDAAQCLGGSIADRYVGTFGDAGILSFDKGKNITSIEGGALVTNSDAIAKNVVSEVAGLPHPSKRSISTGLLKMAFYALFLNPVSYGIPARLPFLKLGRTVYDDRFPLGRYNPWAGAMALTQFRRLDSISATREERAAIYDSVLKSIAGIRTVVTSREARPVHLRYPVMLERPGLRDDLVRDMEHGGLGASRSFPTPISSIPELGNAIVGRKSGFHGGDYVSRSLLTLPTHAYVQERDVGAIAEVLKAGKASRAATES